MQVTIWPESSRPKYVKEIKSSKEEDGKKILINDQCWKAWENWKNKETEEYYKQLEVYMNSWWA